MLSSAEQIRYSKVGLSDDGQRYIDLIVKVVRGNYLAKADSVAKRNGANGLVGQINMGFTITPTSPTQGTTNKVELEFSFVRSGTNTPEVLDVFSMKFLDLDRDAALTLRETVCVDLDQLDPFGFETVIPGYEPTNGNICAFGTCLVAYCKSDPEIISFSSSTKDCWDQQSNLGSAGITSEKVGFQCDNPLSAIDSTPTKCEDCFSTKACSDGGSKREYFPLDTAGSASCSKCTNVIGGRCINPELRSMNLGFRGRSSFKVTMALECLKQYDPSLSDDKNSCSRNFIFSGKHLRCDYPSWDSVANAPATSANGNNPTSATATTVSSNTVGNTQQSVPTTTAGVTANPTPTAASATTVASAGAVPPACKFLDSLLLQLNSQNPNKQACKDLDFNSFSVLCPTEVAVITSKCAELTASSTASP